MSLFDKILLNETYVYRGEKDVLLQKLKRNKLVSRLSKNTFEGRASFSLGVLMGSGGMSLNNGIKVFFEIEEVEPAKYYLNFSTKLRIEHFFFAILFLFIIIGTSLSSDTPFYVPLFMFALWGVTHLWFHFVFRWQEQGLIEDIIRPLKVKKRRKS